MLAIAELLASGSGNIFVKIVYSDSLLIDLNIFVFGRVVLTTGGIYTLHKV